VAPSAAAQPAAPEKPSAKQEAATTSGKLDGHGHAHDQHAQDDAKPAKRKHHARKPKSDKPKGEMTREANKGSLTCKTFRTYDAEKGTYRGYDRRIHTCS
jgi:hypothetical protein